LTLPAHGFDGILKYFGREPRFFPNHYFQSSHLFSTKPTKLFVFIQPLRENQRITIYLFFRGFSDKKGKI